MNETQNIFTLAYRYTRALSRWIKAGRPVRSEEEIKKIFETCCKPCEAYEEQSSSCMYCGCRVNLRTAASLNKIAMATEECPLKKWKDLAVTDGRPLTATALFPVFPKEIEKVSSLMKRNVKT